jgi:LysM repeat protein
MKKYLICLVALVILLNWLSVRDVMAQDETPTVEPPTSAPQPQSQPPTPAQVIEAINNLRISHGIAPLGVHPVLMQIGQMEAEGIAGGMGGHWRPNGLTLGQWLISLGYPLSGDLTLDGYRSENWGFAQSAKDAVAMWLGDDIHTNTMLSLDRSDIGVGIAYSMENESYVIVVETALQTKSGKQQYEAAAILTGIPQTQVAYAGMLTQAAKDGVLPQNMVSVSLATALPDGNVYHDVKYGQTLWSIAIAYGTTIKQIQQLNGLVDTTVQPGQHLLVAQNATQPAPSSMPQIFVLPTQGVSTPAAMQTVTPTIEPTSAIPERDRRNNMYGVIAIGGAALFLGGLFTVMTRKKPI